VSRDQKKSKDPLLSVIVTTYDLRRERYLKRLIKSLVTQTCRAFETIFVIEKHPVLCQVIEAYAKEEGLTNIQTIFNSSTPGISASRNIGMASSTSSIISIVDDDVILPDTWVQSVVTLFNDPGIAAATGPVVPKWEEQSMSWIPPEFHWLFGCSSWFTKNVQSETRNVWGANMAFKRSVLERIGGFSSRMGGIHGKRLHGEENELSLRLKRASPGGIIFSPSMRVEHCISRQRLNIRMITRSSYDMGRTRLVYSGNKQLLDEEMNVVRRIVENGIGKSLLTLPIRPKKSISIFSLAVIVLLFGALGYMNGSSRRSPGL
jgi:GT2 family glycosyltransferase